MVLGGLRRSFAACNNPESLAIIVAVLGLWVGSHFIGIGLGGSGFGLYSGTSSQRRDRSRSIASNGSARTTVRPDQVERIIQRPPSRRRTSSVRSNGPCNAPTRPELASACRGAGRGDV